MHSALFKLIAQMVIFTGYVGCLHYRPHHLPSKKPSQHWRPIAQELTKALNIIRVTPSIDPKSTGKRTHAIKRDESDDHTERDKFRPL